jgi:hypothetical protein
MKHEAMVYIMPIHLIMGTRLAGIRVVSGCLRRIKTILLSMWPTTPPTFILSPSFNSVEKGTSIRFLFGPLALFGIVLDV